MYSVLLFKNCDHSRDILYVLYIFFDNGRHDFDNILSIPVPFYYNIIINGGEYFKSIFKKHTH